jgi:cytochrome b
MRKATMVSTPWNAVGTVPVWDAATRLFHWCLALGFATAWISEAGEELHEGAGYLVLALVAFRFVWGFVGPTHARFADFVRPPGDVVRYLLALAAGDPPRHLGHNPAGGGMIVALLVAVSITAGSGALMVTDRCWGVDWVEDLHALSSDLTLLLIAGHLCGVAVSSLLHHENLVLAMLTGRKRVE